MKKRLLAMALMSTSLSVAAEPSAVVESEISNTQVLTQIESRSEENKKFVAILTGDDQALRLAAVQEMISSGRDDLKNLAVDLAINGKDSAMRLLAIESIVKNTSVLTLQVMPNTAEGAQKKLKGESNFLDYIFTGQAVKIGTSKNGNMTCIHRKEGDCTISITGEQVNLEFSGKRGNDDWSVATSLNYFKDGRFQGVISGLSTRGGSGYNYETNGFIDIY